MSGFEDGDMCQPWGDNGVHLVQQIADVFSISPARCTPEHVNIYSIDSERFPRIIHARPYENHTPSFPVIEEPNAEDCFDMSIFDLYYQLRGEGQAHTPEGLTHTCDHDHAPPQSDELLDSIQRTVDDVHYRWHTRPSESPLETLIRITRSEVRACASSVHRNRSQDEDSCLPASAPPETAHDEIEYAAPPQTPGERYWSAYPDTPTLQHSAYTDTPDNSLLCLTPEGPVAVPFRPCDMAADDYGHAFKLMALPPRRASPVRSPSPASPFAGVQRLARRVMISTERAETSKGSRESMGWISFASVQSLDGWTTVLTPSADSDF
ncbi:hypothetical protein PLICRDRAFT_35148 [Plicaturopsis crispa FD-325 SS-3]|nr:hypothetical protein PLICRDRAFT_35148 [Plicaturopsis crispa FD-325 SS-3]